jgi:tRNA(His) 5'-end guanylyltransferase
MGNKQQENDALGNRMKSYEDVNRIYLTSGIPKVMRLDGKAFHTFLKDAQKPYDKQVMEAMIAAAATVMKEIGGSARFAYIQSDECSIALNDKLTIESEPWFGNNVQKMVSVAAAMMAVNFTRAYNYGEASAYFDSRIFQLPNVTELHNAILWRQFDASKNSISQYARYYFSHKELQGKNGSEMQDMMMLKHGFNWNDAPVWTKRGVLVYRIDRTQKDDIVRSNKNLTVVSGNIVVDWGIPKFSEEPDFLVKLFNKPEETKE